MKKCFIPQDGVYNVRVRKGPRATYLKGKANALRWQLAIEVGHGEG